MDKPASSAVLSYAEAAAVVRTHAQSLLALGRPAESVPLLDSRNRVLAAPVLSDRDQPPFPRSTRDGFACRAAEIRAGSLRIMGQLRAGELWPGGPLQPGEAVEIMTGAAVPPGADCVVMIEHVTTAGDQLSLTLPRPLASGDNIVPAGAEARAGDTIVPAGRRIGVTEIAAAAACGYPALPVFTRPSVAILATGDELVEVADQPQPHQIRNSNSYSLAAQTAALGAAPRILPVVPDTLAATESAIDDARGCDLVLLSGGVSTGKFDFVEQALLNRRAEFFFTGARIQPGKPIVFGKLPSGYFFGLPGNPISTIVTFGLFAAPVLRALSGETSFEPRFALARLAEPVSVPPGLTRFLPAELGSDLTGATIRRIPWQGSGDLAAAARANAFLVVPEHKASLSAGDLVSVLLL